MISMLAYLRDTFYSFTRALRKMVNGTKALI